MNKIRKQIADVLKQIVCKYADLTVGIVLEQAVGRDRLNEISDERLLELLERFLRTREPYVG